MLLLIILADKMASGASRDLSDVHRRHDDAGCHLVDEAFNVLDAANRLSTLNVALLPLSLKVDITFAVSRSAADPSLKFSAASTPAAGTGCAERESRLPVYAAYRLQPLRRWQADKRNDALASIS